MIVPHNRRGVRMFGALASAFSLLAVPALAQSGLGQGMQKKNEPKAKAAQPADAGPVGFKKAPDQQVHFELLPKFTGNQIRFTSKAPKETIEGKVGKFTGTLDLNPRKLDKVEGKFVVAWKDVDTGNATRNKHLLTRPWVDSSSHPDIVFTITGFENGKVSATSDSTIKGDLVGKMEMNGKEKELRIPVTLAWIQKNESGKKPGTVSERIGIKANFKVALADFEIKGKAGSVGTAVAAQQSIKVSAMVAAPERQLSVEEIPQKQQKKPKITGA